MIISPAIASDMGLGSSGGARIKHPRNARSIRSTGGRVVRSNSSSNGTSFANWGQMGRKCRPNWQFATFNAGAIMAIKAKTGSSRRRKSAKRELIETGKDKRYVRRNAQGEFHEVDNVSRSLSQ